MIKLTENAIQVLEKRYLKRDENGTIIETPEGMFKRVADTIAKAEKTEELRKEWSRKFYDVMSNLEFLPNSPTIRNAGATGGSYSACFYLDIEDSRESIFDVLKKSVEIQAFGGGTGYNFSKLRPEGSLIKTTMGRASGPVGFMKVFDYVVGSVIQQGGVRQGAQMGLLDITHPDIEKFINSKQEEGVLTNFNISVIITDEFMSSINKESELWDKIIVGAYRNGEPGVLFIDTINKFSPTYPYQVLNGCNPCLISDTLLFDGDRLSRIDTEGVIFRSWKTGIKETINLKLSDGTAITLTPDHLIKTEKDGFIHAQDSLGYRISRVGDRFFTSENTEHEEKLVLLGFLYGDGWTRGHRGISVRIDEKKEPDVVSLLKSYGFYHTPSKDKLYCNKGQLSNLYIDEKEYNLNIIKEKTYDKVLPESIVCSKLLRLRSFLRGLYSANGSVVKDRFISFKSTSKLLIQQLQTILSAFGIKAHYSHNDGVEVKWHNGDYRSKPSYNLYITNRTALERFAKNIGFVETTKNEKLDYILKNRTTGRPTYPKVLTIEKTGPKEVYDFKMKDGLPYNQANGIVVHNCSEQVLGDKESCNLGSINLSKFVEDTGGGKPEINWKSLKSVVGIAVRFLDNVIDVNNYPIPEIETETKKFRKIGLGVMGWADLLIKLKIMYGSQESLELAERIMKFINNEAIRCSEELLQEKGHGTWEGFLDPSIYAKDKTNPLFHRRNATLTTIAPTGSLSLIAGCSAGIEPIFSFEFKKKCIGSEITIINPLLLEWLQDHDITIEGVPDYFIEAKDVTPEQHIRMQATYQRHVHNAVSKTVNLPNSATIKDIDYIFKLAHSLNCKGITVYRQGSREYEAQIPLSQEADKKPPMNSGKLLSNMDNSPEGSLQPPEWMWGGRQMIRTGEGTLWVHLFEDPISGYKELWSQISKEGRTLSSMNASIGRLATLALNGGNCPKCGHKNCGVPWSAVEKQLRGIIGEKTNWFNGQQVMSPPDGIAKVIKKRILDNSDWPVICPQTEVGGPTVDEFINSIYDTYGTDLCPDCASPLIHDEGCKGGRCPNCGFSNCV